VTIRQEGANNNLKTKTMKTIAVIIFPIVLITEFILSIITVGLYLIFVNIWLDEKLFTKQLLNYIRK